MNIIDLLLEVDENKLSRPSKEIELTRLSQMVGSPFIVEVRALSMAKFEDLQRSCTNKKGDIDGAKFNVLIALECVYADNKLLFKNKDLMEKFKVHSFKDLASKLLLTGEIGQIAGFVVDLMGFEGGIEEIKN